MTRLLTFLGRHAAAAMALGVFIGVAVPDLARLARPVLEPTVFAMLAASMLRLDPGRLGRPAALGLLIPGALVWLLVLGPVVVYAAVTTIAPPPALAVALVTWAACPPLVSVAAIATIMRVDPAPALILMIAATFLFPFTLPPLLLHLVDLQIEISAIELTFRLALFVAAAAVVAVALRRVLGQPWLERRAPLLDGVFVILMLTFAVSIMGGVLEEIVERPLRLLGYTAAAFAVSLSMQVVALAVFAWSGRRRAASVAIASGNRNMAVILAASAGAFGSEGILFLAVLQFPIYLLPILTAPLYRRWTAGANDDAG